MDKPDRIERIRKIEDILLENNKGWRRTELAERLKVNRSTAKRDIDYICEKEILPLEIKDNKIYLKSDNYLSNVKMNMHEMLALHLATRLLVKKSSLASRHYASLLRKISQSFSHHSQLISRYMEDTAAGLDEQEQSREYYRRTDRLEILNQAWTKQKMVKIDYRSKGGLKSYTLGIYCFEPYSEGISLHIIGLCEGETHPRNFKFERLEAVRILNRDYHIPDDFNPHEYFRDSWGIWTTDKEPVTVKLLFKASAVDRVKENIWHVSEQTEEQSDGSLIWTGKIAEPLEMVPWIRSWGDQVRVLEPNNLLLQE